MGRLDAAAACAARSPAASARSKSRSDIRDPSPLRRLQTRMAMRDSAKRRGGRLLD